MFIKMKERRHRILLADRDNIEWYPAIDPSRCTGCGVCFAFCPKGVFVMDDQTGKAVVTNPYECVVLCSGCVPKCLQQAISFPRREDFEHFVRYGQDAE
jgi:NAD-dependent dihydropyrimidine dehydrogenase PreA subunit